MDELIDDIQAVFNPPKWKFWKPRNRRADIRFHVESALRGDLGAMQIYGVKLTETGWIDQWNQIRRQVRRAT